MRILLLIILFSICGTRTIVSQIGGFHHDYMDTINNIFHNFYKSPIFDNYPNNSITFPETIYSNEKTYRIQVINSLDWKKLKDNYLLEELPDSLFNILFELDIINHWTWPPINPVWQWYEPNDTIVSNRKLTVFIPDSIDNLSKVSDLVDDSGNSEHWYKDKGDFFRKMRPCSKMYLVGNIPISENFVSKLIYVFMKDEILTIQGLYLVNIKSKRLRSVTRIISELCIDCSDSSHIQVELKLLDNRIFSLKYKPIYTENMDGYMKEINYDPNFYYDDEGYLHIIPYNYDFP
ncbi:MAG: hypothetical protein FWD66_10650 [Paludibacter sp.]|nr:hypothetical protein [Paludibacter sp.]